LAGKVDSARVAELTALKADREEMLTLLADKVDSARLAGLTALKADREEMLTLLADKVDSARLAGLTALKADREEMLTLLAGKVDSSRLAGLFGHKADREEILELLAAKVGLAQLAELAERKADRKFAEDLYHQKADQVVVSGLSEQQQNSRAALHTLKLRMLDMERRLSLLLEEARRRFPEPIQQDQAAAMLLAGRGQLDAMYSEFEDLYRGTRDDIKSRQAVYFERILQIPQERRKLALDVGCGRGEFLELLSAYGFTAIGVDLNENMVTRCRDLGLDAQHGDALEYLKSLATDSHSLISAFHVVEHLPHKVLVALLDEALRALAPGGVLILETPNPKNLLVGSCNFYLDPTHLNPIPEQLLRFLVEARGFVNPEVIPLHPVPDSARPLPGLAPPYMNELLFGPQDYGVIAWKA
jgi:SAM-dependent methyltransferase